MNIWTKIFRSDKKEKDKDKETIIALAVADKLKIFKSIDDAILYLYKKDNKALINELDKLRHRISSDKKVKAVRITEDNEIIEYDNLEELKKDSE
ncbi:MAG: hypothetical protein KDD00_07140 [Ignavibacteriae bacterium]|nr:hypothetical protein [Ignavibacteriota bacterium]